MRRQFPFLLLLAFVALVPGALGQSPELVPGVFPEALLDGMARFDLAISYQGDLRGNFGPCG